MNRWRAPANGPSKPSARRRRTKSRRFQGVHWLNQRLLVEIDPGDKGQRMAQLQSDQQPIFRGRPRFLLVTAERRLEGDGSRCFRHPARERPIVEVIVIRRGEGLIDVVGKDEANDHRPSLSPVS